MEDAVFLMTRLVQEQEVKIGELNRAINDLYRLEEKGQLFVAKLGCPRKGIWVMTADRTLTDLGHECVCLLSDLMIRQRLNQITTLQAIHKLRSSAEQYHYQLKEVVAA